MGWFWFGGSSSAHADIKTKHNPAQKRRDDNSQHNFHVLLLFYEEQHFWFVGNWISTSYKLRFQLSLSDVPSNIWIVKQIQRWAWVWISLAWGDGGHICQWQQLLCQGGLATSLYLAAGVTSQPASDHISRFSVWCQRCFPWTVSHFVSIESTARPEWPSPFWLKMQTVLRRHFQIQKWWLWWLIFTGSSQIRTSCLTVTLFYSVVTHVSLNSPSYLWDGAISLIKFLSPCKNVYMYAHLGNTLLITWLLNMDSERLPLLLLFF